jgi:hypothetical protein
MINKIVFLVSDPFNRRDFERFGIELLQKNGFEVEVWDMSNILNPALVKNYSPPDPIDLPYCRVFTDKDYALNKLKTLSSDTFIINFIAYLLKSYYVYKAISVSQAEYAVFMANALPSVESSRRSLFYYLKKLRKVTWKKLVSLSHNLVTHGFYRLPFAWLGVKPASLILAGGEQCLKYPYPTAKTTEVLWAHTFDYDLYLKEREVPFTERPIAVFLDQYLPFHPDFIQMKVQPPLNADKYYPVLNKFFGLVEQELGLKVVIAAHPRSNYEKHPDYFEGREWVRGKTIRLVKESQLVLTHASTALNFANLFCKPVIFMTSHDLDKSGQGHFIRTMANWFGKEPIFINDNSTINWERELTVSASHYDRYRRAYMKTEHSEDLPFWQIVANRLKNGDSTNKPSFTKCSVSRKKVLSEINSKSDKQCKQKTT